MSTQNDDVVITTLLDDELLSKNTPLTGIFSTLYLLKCYYKIEFIDYHYFYLVVSSKY